jgi:exodeoxyribonuclease V
MTTRARKTRRRAGRAYVPTDLNPDQARAVAELSAAIDRGDAACRLLGFAGTGKSFATVRLLRAYAHERPVLLTAPTNKATAVLRAMAEAIGGQVASTTIHKALGLRPEVDEDRGQMRLRQIRTPEIPDGALVLIDEASMVDAHLLRCIHSAAHAADAQLLFVGDPYQLPPIFAGESPAFAGAGVTAHLTQIVRQAADHPILAMTARIRAAMDGGDMPYFATQRHAAGSLILLDSAAFETALWSAFSNPRYAADPDDCRVLAWTNQRTRDYNRLLRRALLGERADRDALLPGEIVVACTPIPSARVNVGDFLTVEDALPVSHQGIPAYRAKVQVHRDEVVEVFAVRPEGYAAYQERLSSLVEIARALQREAQIRPLTDLEDRCRRDAWIDFFAFKDRSFVDLRPIHASTVHKSQGSTYRQVFVDLSDIGRNTRRDVLLRLLYVALTRARGDVVVTGKLPDRLYAAGPERDEVGF